MCIKKEKVGSPLLGWKAQDKTAAATSYCSSQSSDTSLSTVIPCSWWGVNGGCCNIYAYVWVFTNLSSLEGSSTLSKQRDTELWNWSHSVLRCSGALWWAAERYLSDIYLGWAVSPPSQDLGVQICSLSQSTDCGNGSPVFNDCMVSCQSPWHGFLESSSYLTPHMWKVRFLACPEYLSLWMGLSRFCSDKLFFPFSRTWGFWPSE